MIINNHSSIPRSACKPSFVLACGRVAIIYLDQPLPTGSPAPRRCASELREATYPPVERPRPLAPGPSAARAPKHAAWETFAPTGCLVLQAVGFTLPATSPPPRCALTAPFHLCLCPERPSAVCFLWHFPWSCLRWPLATTVPCPARTFLRLLSQPATARPTLGLMIDE